MSYQVVYGMKTVKVACPATSTVNQLMELSKAKLKLDTNTFIDLSYKNQVLDSLLPLRLTNVPNNAKLTLSIATSTQKEVTIKVLVTYPPTIVNQKNTFIQKIDNNKTIKELLNHIEKDSGIKLLNVSEGTSAQLQILNLKIDEVNFNTSKIINLVGHSTTSMVIRLTYILASSKADGLKRKEEQDKINQLQLQQQYTRNQLKREENERKRELEESTEIERSNEDVNMEENQEKDSVEASINKNHIDIPSQNNTSNESTMQSTPSTQSIEKTISTISAENIEPDQPSNTPEEELDDLIYLPSSEHINHQYDHNDSAYELTVAQAQTYHNLITKSMRPQKPKPRNVPITIPERYLVRIRFPDRTTLQLNLENGPTVKLGNLLKKLDDFLLPQHKNSFNLKFSYPPFTTIPISFLNNDKYLHQLKISKNSSDIFTERTSLIWESTSAIPGPFINQESGRVKQNSERVEVQLENRRGDLPDEPKVSNELKVEPNSGSSSNKKEVKKGVPKWLKFSK